MGSFGKVRGRNVHLRLLHEERLSEGDEIYRKDNRGPTTPPAVRASVWRLSATGVYDCSLCLGGDLIFGLSLALFQSGNALAYPRRIFKTLLFVTT